MSNTDIADAAASSSPPSPPASHSSTPATSHEDARAGVDTAETTVETSPHGASAGSGQGLLVGAPAAVTPACAPLPAGGVPEFAQDLLMSSVRATRVRHGTQVPQKSPTQCKRAPRRALLTRSSSESSSGTRMRFWKTASGVPLQKGMTRPVLRRALLQGNLVMLGALV
jgi:hypothetical protein